MKKLIGLIAIVMLCCTTMFAACLSIHEHTFAEGWTYDETSHWHEPTCEHTDKKGMLSAHNYGEWKVVDSPEVGVVTMQRACTVCKYTETKTEGEHEHTFSESWAYDETNHWHAATCEHTTEKAGLEPHVFGDRVEVSEGVKYTCNICGYVKTEISEYMVTPEEYEAILSEISIFKVNMTTAYGEEIMFIAGGNVKLYQSNAVTDYYIYDGSEYYKISEDYEESYWVKEVCTQQIYKNNTSGWGLPSFLLNRFADFSYDVTTRSYKAEEIVKTYDNYSVKCKNLSLSFKNNKLTAATFSYIEIDEDGSEMTKVYSYSDIGTASVELPTNIHEHTYSSEWSFNMYEHFHSATCKHSTKRTDVEDHTFIKGVCSVCGYNLLVLSDDGKTVIGIADNDAKEVTIPQGVTAIGQNALTHCQFTEIVIPEGVTSIGGYAFQGCSALVSVSLPEGLLTIGERAFDNCTALTSIKIPGTLQNIEFCLFSNCTKLKTVILSEGTKTINNFAFKGCTALSEIYIPKSLTEIKQDVFDDTSLSKIYYNGNESEWSAIAKDEFNNELNAATVYFYSETEPTNQGNYWHYVDGMPVEW